MGTPLDPNIKNFSVITYKRQNHAVAVSNREWICTIDFYNRICLVAGNIIIK